MPWAAKRAMTSRCADACCSWRALRNRGLAGHGIQYLCPQRHHGIIHLGQIVEAAEGDVAIGQCRKRRDDDVRAWRRKTQPRLRQAPDFLREAVLLTGRQGPGVGEEVVHGLHAGGREVAQPGCLHRRGLPGERRQAVVRCVARKVDQDVNPVVAYQFGHVLIGQSHHRMPRMAAGFEPLAEFVITGTRRVAKQLQRGGAGGQGCKNAIQKIAYGMDAKIPGDEAHTQAAVRIGWIVPSQRWSRAAGNHIAETPCLRQQMRNRLVGEVVVYEEQAVVGFGEIRLEFQRAACALQGACKLPKILQGVSEVAVGLRVIRLDGQGALVAFNGLVELSPVTGKPRPWR
jgi:hypothetical protein